MGSGWVSIARSKKWRRLIIGIVILIYAYSVSHFVFDYFARYADQRSEVWFASMRQVSRKAGDLPQRRVVLASAGYYDFLQVALYEKLSATDIQSVWTARTQTAGDLEFRYHNLLMDAQCSPQHLSAVATGTNSVFIVRDGCWKDMKRGRAINDFYGNAVWHVMQTSDIESVTL